MITVEIHGKTTPVQHGYGGCTTIELDTPLLAPRCIDVVVARLRGGLPMMRPQRMWLRVAIGEHVGEVQVLKIVNDRCVVTGAINAPHWTKVTVIGWRIEQPLGPPTAMDVMLGGGE